MTALEPLDEFLASPGHRDVSRALLASVFGAHGLVFVVGETKDDAGARLVSALAKAWPTPHVHLVLIEAAPTRATHLLDGQGQPRVIEGRGVADALRAALRQDPDVLALPSMDEGLAPLVVAAAQTGHGMVLAGRFASGEAFLEALCGGDASLSASLEPMVQVVVELVAAADGRGVMQRVRRRCETGLATVAVATPDGVQLFGERLPRTEVRPPPPPRLAPPLASRPPPTVAPRRAWLAETATGDASTRHALGTATAFRPQGMTWPRCRDCEAPLQLVVQLDLAALPAEFDVPVRNGLAQLFVCTEGCDTFSESAPGVVAEVLTPERLSLVTSPGHEGHVVVAPGAIVGWRPFEEGMKSDDESWPLRADKLGGWPAWEQGEEWPREADGSPMTLLFQFAEDEVREGGTPPTWSFEEARLVPGLPSRRVLDPERPCHFPAILTAESVGFLFLSRDGRLVFRWQTG
jgi:hypothetical protein